MVVIDKVALPYLTLMQADTEAPPQPTVVLDKVLEVMLT